MQRTVIICDVCKKDMRECQWRYYQVQASHSEFGGGSITAYQICEGCWKKHIYPLFKEHS